MAIIHGMMRIARRFIRSEQGSALPLIGLGMMVLLGSAGIAIDMGRVQLVQAKMSNALDAAGLAAGATISTNNVQSVTNNYFYANFPTNFMGTTITSLTATPNGDNSVIALSVAGTVPTTFMKLFGMSTVAVSATSQITLSSKGMELVMVLDNTGSMNCEVTNESNCGTSVSDSKINALKTAANEMLSILYGGSETISNLWVGVVPFSQAVNIGTTYSTWMDTAYDSTLEFGPTLSGSSCQSYTGNSATLSGGSDFIGSKATGIITFTNNPSNGNTITLNGTTWTFVSGTASGNQTKIGSNLSTTMTSLASNLNASSNSNIKVATYYATSTSLEITDDTAGAAGNSYTLASNNTNAKVTTESSTGTYSSSTCAYTLNGNGATARFVQMNNWAGCVMARTSPYDISDDVPSTAPFQAYDYPPTADAGTAYDPWITTKTSGSGTSSSPYTTKTTYNYSYQSSLPGYYGPNLFCPQAVTPMVAEKTTVANAINAMTAGGSTLIDIGMAWGQRMLSPNWRGLWGGEMNSNNLPLNYNTPLMNKVLILMTDGMNQFDPSNFTAYQYLDSNVLGTTNFTTANNTLDTRTLAVCTALKNNGVLIYTIGFGTSSDVNTSLLQSCATNSSYYFLAPTNAELQTAFQQIGDSLANLRVSQ